MTIHDYQAPNYSIERVPIRDASGQITGWTSEARYVREEFTPQPTPRGAQLVEAPPIVRAGEAVSATERVPSVAHGSSHVLMRQREKLFSRTASFDDLVELAVSDDSMSELASRVAFDHLIDSSDDAPQPSQLLDDWCARHADLARPSEPGRSVDLSQPPARTVVDLRSATIVPDHPRGVVIDTPIV